VSLITTSLNPSCHPLLPVSSSCEACDHSPDSGPVLFGPLSRTTPFPSHDQLGVDARFEPYESSTMATFMENAYSMVHLDNTADQPTQQELKTHLEKGTDESKVETMKRILTMMLNGDPMPSLLMHIIRFVMPSKSKQLKKLLYFYYEICPKLDAGGKLKQEMILVWYDGLYIPYGDGC